MKDFSITLFYYYYLKYFHAFTEKLYNSVIYSERWFYLNVVDNRNSLYARLFVL